jgi:hypothetical protein
MSFELKIQEQQKLVEEVIKRSEEAIKRSKINSIKTTKRSIRSNKKHLKDMGVYIEMVEAKLIKEGFSAEVMFLRSAYDHQCTVSKWIEEDKKYLKKMKEDERS